MRYMSLFSGIEAASVAWRPLGWEPVAFCEIDEFPSAVLAHHYPDMPNLGDITKVDWREAIEKHGRPDVIVGGSPCQSFSVAGGRESLRGESRLMFEYIRALREVRPTWFLWENVPGVLNTRDDAFAQLLGEVQDVGYGSVAWRVLDAQFFGVAQRRRRVFLVGRLGNGGGAAAVLFEPESVSGNTQTSKQKREELARAAVRGAQEGCGPIAFKYSAGAAARTMPTYEDGSNLAVAYDCSRCGLRLLEPDSPLPCGEEECPRMRATAIRTANTGANDSGIADEVAHTIDTTGPEAVAFAQNTRDEVRLQGDGTISGALSAQPGMKQTTYVAQRINAQASNGEEIVGALCARDYKGVGDEYVQEGKVICQRLGSCGCDKGTRGGKGPLVQEEVSGTLATGNDQILCMASGQANAEVGENMACAQSARQHKDPQIVTDGYVVRRLTPTECERLQGFPDGWTDIPYKGKEHAPDTPRYKSLGNSMAVPVMRWLGERIQMVQEIIDERQRGGSRGRPDV